MTTIAEVVRDARESLINSDSAQLDAELLLCESLSCERSYIFTWPEKTLTTDQLKSFQGLMSRRLAGEPVAHILGRRDFWDLNLAVDDSTLIPRPDTETLVEEALALFPAGAERVLDLGTGTGAIALALANEWPESAVRGVDQSAAAVLLAQKNKKANHIENVSFEQSSWFECLSAGETFQLVVSNPPYIDQCDPHLSQGDVRFEPRSALVAADRGMADLRFIIEQSPKYLCVGAYVLLEHGYQQASVVREMFSARGFCRVESRRDMAGHERVSFACWSGENY